jgi:hypothetical protein
MNTDVKVAPDKKTLEELIEAWKDKNVKAGWNLV